MTTTPPVINISAYRFAPMDDLKSLRERLATTCREWGLKGTILLSTEGINLFVAGYAAEIEQLLTLLKAIPGLEVLTPKVSESREQPFTRMLVKIKKEIIAFGVPSVDPYRQPAPRLSARELKQWLDEGRPVTLLDTRNDFEISLGTFENAKAIGIRQFRNFPAAVDKLTLANQQYPIVTFCTGGIRCEKAAPYLIQRGFENVYQLDGGILKYFEECGGEHYVGECFVFDKRVGLEASLEESPRTLCFVCQTALSAEEQLDRRFVESVSCPHCFRSSDERRARELAERHEAIRRVTTPLPGSVPYENNRPLKVPGAFAGSTLLEVLTGILGAVNADWQAECDRGNLLDSDRCIASAKRIVKDGERYFHRRPGSVEPDVNAAIRILHEDGAIIVVDKPAPLPMHPSGRFNRNTLQSILREVYAPQKPRPAHRLDANTTGVVVFTRTVAFARLVQPQFERGEVEKLYLARIHGHPPADEFVCEAPIADSPGEIGSRAVDPEHGLPARTDFRVIRREPDGTALVEARPQTGRTHQIRVHLWHLGWPVVGDPVYLRDGSLGEIPTLAVDAMPLCLHAYRLTLNHPVSGERVSFEAGVPVFVNF